MSPTKSIVTGGAGFIGSHLVERLLNEGHQVIVIDNFVTGRRHNLRACDAHPNITIVEADVNDRAAIVEYIRNADYVFHFAALADIVPSIQKPLDYFRANVDGTIALLETVRAAAPSLKKFLYTASSSCYGIPDAFPTPETAPIRPEYPYALTKYLGEEVVLHWGKIYKLPVVSLRLFNVYGPRARTSGTYGAVFGIFLAQKLAGKPFTVVGDGNQTRDFTYVTDIVEAFVHAAKAPLRQEIFNVGSGGTYSVNALVRLLGGEVTYIPKRPGEPDCTFADITKIRTLLGWQPHVSFEDGVKQMVDHIEEWRAAPVWDQQSIAEATKEWFQYLTH